ncbi:MAG: GNAT family N-acetyltransferase [Candidatus Heimdallarchaeota archaeon]|nr:GNAT family N-acetyltransferase [Candidatus Heimdallarchaeota archaeon]
MSSSLSSLYQLKYKDIKKAANVLARAFDDDKMLKFVIPDDETRKKAIVSYFTSRIKIGMLYGKVYATSPALEGLAIWFFSDDYKITTWRIIRTGGLKVVRITGKEALNRLQTVTKFTSTLRKNYAPEKYWYLAPIAIDPNHQGKGYASKLIRPMLSYVDSEQLPIVLDTQSEINVSIYKHYGFEMLAESILTGTSIPHYLMGRKPAKID